MKQIYPQKSLQLKNLAQHLHFNLFIHITLQGFYYYVEEKIEEI